MKWVTNSLLSEGFMNKGLLESKELMAGDSDKNELGRIPPETSTCTPSTVSQP